MPTNFILSKNMKIVKRFRLKIVIFTALKYCSILHGCVCIMATTGTAKLVAKRPVSWNIAKITFVKKILAPAVPVMGTIGVTPVTSHAICDVKPLHNNNNVRIIIT